MNSIKSRPRVRVTVRVKVRVSSGCQVPGLVGLGSYNVVQEDVSDAYLPLVLR